MSAIPFPDKGLDLTVRKSLKCTESEAESEDDSHSSADENSSVKSIGNPGEDDGMSDSSEQPRKGRRRSSPNTGQCCVCGYFRLDGASLRHMCACVEHTLAANALTSQNWLGLLYPHA